MRKLFLTTAAFTVLFASSAFAAEIVTINVNGMVCDFCARAIEKVFMQQEPVESVNVDLTAKQITATMKEGQTLDDETIKKLVNDSGYAFVSADRSEAAHE